MFIVAIGKYILYIYIYIYYIYSSNFPLLYTYINIYIYIYIYIVRGKRQINYKFIPTGLFRGCPLIRGFPDEGETTKQACRDELVVYLSLSFFPPKIYTSLYSYVLSTVLRKSKFFTLYIFIYVYISFVFSSKR